MSKAAQQQQTYNPYPLRAEQPAQVMRVVDVNHHLFAQVFTPEDAARIALALNATADMDDDDLACFLHGVRGIGGTLEDQRMTVEAHYRTISDSLRVIDALVAAINSRPAPLPDREQQALAQARGFCSMVRGCIGEGA